MKKAVLALALCLALLMPMMIVPAGEVRADDYEMCHIYSEDDLEEALALDASRLDLMFETNLLLTRDYRIVNKKIWFNQNGYMMTVDKDASFALQGTELTLSADDGLDYYATELIKFRGEPTGATREKPLFSLSDGSEMLVAERVHFYEFVTKTPLFELSDTSKLMFADAEISDCRTEGGTTEIGLIYLKDNAEVRLKGSAAKIHDNRLDMPLIRLVDRAKFYQEESQICDNKLYTYPDDTDTNMIDITGHGQYHLTRGFVQNNENFRATICARYPTKLDREDRPTVICDGSQINENKAWHGGAMFLENAYARVINNSYICFNQAYTVGGAIEDCHNGSTYLELGNAAITNNISNGECPGIRLRGGSEAFIRSGFRCYDNLYDAGDPSWQRNLEVYRGSKLLFDPELDDETKIGFTFEGGDVCQFFAGEIDYRDVSEADMPAYEQRLTSHFFSDKNRYDFYATRGKKGVAAVRKEIQEYSEPEENYDQAPRALSVTRFATGVPGAVFELPEICVSRMGREVDLSEYKPNYVLTPDGEKIDVEDARWSPDVRQTVTFTEEYRDITVTLRKGWYREDGKDYYLDYGMPRKGIHKIGKTKYLFGNDGSKQFGWHVIGGKQMYFDPKSGGQLTGKRKIGKTTYLLAPDGGKIFGWARLDGKDYYFDPRFGGGMVTGKRRIGKTEYFLNNKGYKDYGWKLLGGKKYYFDKRYGGGMVTGLRKVGNATYYFRPRDTKPGANDKGSALVNGSVVIKGKRYYFNKSGMLYKVK